MIDQQPQIELNARELRGRQRIDLFAQRRPRNRERVDLIRLPRSRITRRLSAVSRGATRTTRSPRPIKKRSKAPDTCRQSSSAQTRSAFKDRAHSSAAAKPREPTWIVLPATSSPVEPSSAAMVCERLCRSAPSTIIVLVPFLCAPKVDTRRTRLVGGAATLLSSHAEHPDSAASDTTKPSQARGGPTAWKRVSSPPVRTFSAAPDDTDSPEESQQAWKAAARSAASALPLTRAER